MGNKKTDSAVTGRYNVKVENSASAKLEFSWEEGNDSACHPFPAVSPKCSSPDLKVGSSNSLAAAEKVTYSLTDEVKRTHSQSVLSAPSLLSLRTVIRTTCSVLYETNPSATILAPIQYAEWHRGFTTRNTLCISTPWITIYATCKQQ